MYAGNRLRTEGRLGIGCYAVIMLLLMAASASAAPPHPDVLKQVASGQAEEPFYLAHRHELLTRGIDAGSLENDCQCKLLSPAGLELTPGELEEIRILVVLVDFSDQRSGTEAESVDSLVFDTVGRTVRDFYRENSCGQVDLVTVNLPSAIGWQRAPQPYSYYANGRNGVGNYPQNTQRLVEDVVAIIDDAVDFADYDNTGSGTVDALVIVHSGRGAEYSGDDNDIWSHKWSINPQQRDGVTISEYCIQPEYLNYAGDMTIGVHCHELGHLLFDLPDLYDTDYSSRGIGKWGVMSFGAWLGPFSRGGSPAHFSPYCKIKAGLLEPVVLEYDQVQTAIPNVVESGVVFRLWTEGSVGNEYFLVENRQKIGYDQYLPGDGLLVWHIDEGKSNNTQEWWPGLTPSNHYLCALEQADGDTRLEFNLGSGDYGDPFPGNEEVVRFDSSTTPSSLAYSGASSKVALDNITESADTIWSDLLVGRDGGEIETGGDDPILPTTMQLAQNYPNPFNPVTTIEFFVPATGKATVEIFNIAGREVCTLLDETVSEGDHSVTWNGTDQRGKPVASGIYLYRLQIASNTQVRKMVLLK